MYYDSCAIYIDSATTVAARIVRIDAVIDALESSMLKAAAGENISEYSLDDGQTKISTVYRSTDQIMNSIMGLEKLKQYYINRLNGRVVRLVDSKNFLRSS
jgi:hypothetical protein